MKGESLIAFVISQAIGCLGFEDFVYGMCDVRVWTFGCIDVWMMQYGYWDLRYMIYVVN